MVPANMEVTSRFGPEIDGRRRIIRRTTVWLALILATGPAVLCPSANAQNLLPVPGRTPPQEPSQADVEQRGMLQKLLETQKAIQAENWLEAAEKFDAAWELTCQGDDPLLDRTGADVNELAPGRTSLIAGGKASLEDLFRNAPAQFRDQFQLQFADIGRRKITAALASGDADLVRRELIRFQFTPSATQGLKSLARLRIDEGDFLEAALLLERSQLPLSQPDRGVSFQVAWCYARAGLLQDAADLLNRLAADGPVQLGGRTVSIPAASDRADWIRSEFGVTNIASPDWPQPLGDYRRLQTQPRTFSGLTERWQASMFEMTDVLYAEEYNPLLKEFVDLYERALARFLKLNSTMIPASTAITSGSVVYIRTPLSIRAYDIATGKLLWEAGRPERQLRSWADARNALNRDPSQVSVPIEATTLDPRGLLFDQLLRTNTAFQMSISGGTLYSVEESSGASWTDSMRLGLGNGAEGMPATNYIRAYDAKTGLFLWEAGGQTQNANPAFRGSGQPNLLAGHYFLGAPLVLGRRIYVLAESGEGIFLIRLGEPDPRIPNSNPTVLASQLISVPRSGLSAHPLRKHAGLIPSFAQGLLICPTCDDRIIAISAEDLSIRWIFRYAGVLRPQEIGGDSIVLFGGRDFQDTSRIDRDNRWIDFLPRISGNRIFLTPRDADQLYCLDLQTGKELWSLPRGGFHQIAAVNEEQIVLLGNHVAASYSVKDGREQWATQLGQGTTCGRAVVTNSLLQIPSDAPAITSLDLKTGQVLVHQPWAGTSLPGNLLSTEAGLVSVGMTSASGFGPATEASPSIQATELLLTGRSGEAREMLEKHLATAPDDRTSRALLIEVLLQLLRSDFAANRSCVDQVRALLDAAERDVAVLPVLHSMIGMNLTDASVLTEQLQGSLRQQQDELAELIAKGIESSGSGDLTELSGSLADLLSQLPTAHQQPVATGMLQRSKAEALLAGMRAAIRQRTPEEQRQIDSTLTPRAIEVAGVVPPGADRIHFVSDLLKIGLPNSALGVLKQESLRWPKEASHLLLEQTHLALTQTAGEPAVTAANELLREWSAADEPWSVFAFLSDVRKSTDPRTFLRWTIPDASARDQFITGIQNKTPELLKRPASVWSETAKVTVSDDRSVLPFNRVTEMIPKRSVPLFGAPGLYRGWSFATLRNNEKIVAYDPDGTLKWTIRPPAFIENEYVGYATDSWASAWGHLLVLNINGTVMAVDGTLVDSTGAPRLLWQKNIERLAPDNDQEDYREYIAPPDRIPQFLPYPSGYFPVAPATADGVAVISGRRVLVLHPLTGQPIWQVDGIPRDAMLLTDNDQLLILSESARQIEVRAMLDGSLRSTVRLPEWWGDAIGNVGSSVEEVETDEGVDTWWRVLAEGHRCVVFRLTEGKSFLESRDLLTDEVEWSMELPQQTVFSNAAEDVVALLSDGEQLRLVQLDTGKVLFEQKVDKLPVPRQLYLRASQGQYLVLPEARTEDDPALDFINPVTDAVHVFGRIWAISQQDLILSWSKEVDHRFVQLSTPTQTLPVLPNAPILVLLSRDGEGRPPVRNTRISAKILDVRSGKELYYDENTGRNLNEHWLSIDAAKKQLLLSFEDHIMTISYPGVEKPAP
ncbi:MAG: PQQ-binding-like beta-propeller repeat protein [Planctomycetaceae bacterium]